MKKWIVAGVALVVVSFIGGLTLYGVVVHPWQELPEEDVGTIEERWQKARGWAVVDPAVKGSDEELRAALDRYKAIEDHRAVEEITRYEELPEAAASMVDHLIRWNERGGGLGTDGCLLDPKALSAIDLMSITRIAIKVAASDPDQIIPATLRLAAFLRKAGTMIHVVVGFTIADEVRKWAEASKLEPKAIPAYATYAPRASEIFPAIAREAVCHHDQARAIFAQADADGSKEISMWSSVERELLLWRWYHGRRLKKGHAASEDLDALAAIFVAEEVESPKSALLAVTIFGLDGLITKMAGMLEAWGGFVSP